MKPIKVFAGLLVVLILILVGVVALFFISSSIEEIQEESPSIFTVLSTGSAADYGYAVFNYRGEGNVTIVAYDKEPQMRIIILNDSDAIQATRFPELVEDVSKLKEYGYEVTVTDKPGIGRGIYIVPTGAVPSYVLFNLQAGLSNGTIIYIGEKDLMLSRGIKKLDWYENLSENQTNRVVHYSGTLDEFIEGGNSLVDDILYERWHQEEESKTALSESGINTIKINKEEAKYLRIVYELEGLCGIYDSEELLQVKQAINPAPGSIYPWEKSTLRFSLNKTNGTAIIFVKKDGKVIENEILRRVTDENIFLKKMQYEEPGEYVIEVSDNSGRIASGLLHVKDLRIKLIERRGLLYTFSTTVDGRPLENTETHVSLGNSTEKGRFYVSNGELTVSARLEQGDNIFNIEMLGTRLPVTVHNDQTNLLDFYITYGVPGLVLVAMVYFGARMSRKPIYRLRFGDSATTIRKEIYLPVDSAVGGLKRIRKEMNLGNAPITPEEFSISLKRYVTNGADISEGNIEEILQKLVKLRYLESHRDYYQLKGEGDVRKNALRRIIRDKLIENGVDFKESCNKFMIKDREIGFFGEKFSKKAIIVTDDTSEIKRTMSEMSDYERARYRLLRSNGKIDFVPIDKLNDVL